MPHRGSDPEERRAAGRAAMKRHYAAHPEQYRERNALVRAKKVAYVQELRTGSCTDCKGTYPWYVMEFDHRDPADKVAPIARLVTQSWRKLNEELAKCDLVCANCHAARTYHRRQADVAQRQRHGAQTAASESSNLSVSTYT